MQAIWGVTDHLCHICTGDYSEESHWVAQGHRGNMACQRLLTRGLGDVRYGATLWAIAIILYSKGVRNHQLSDTVVWGQYDMPQAVSKGVVLGGMQVMLQWAAYLRCRVAVRASHGPLGLHGTARGVVLVGMQVYGVPQVFGV